MSKTKKSIRHIERIHKGTLFCYRYTFLFYLFIYLLFIAMENSSADKDQFPTPRPLLEDAIKADAMQP